MSLKAIARGCEYGFGILRRPLHDPRVAFADIVSTGPGVELLQRSLRRGRLGHAYLLTGNHLEELEEVARNLIKTLNCDQPVMESGDILPSDCCDQCLNCRKVISGGHADVRWVRPESKSRLILTDQIRSLISQINLKANDARFKCAVIVAADRLKVEAANAFLKTLEEPPPDCVIILLSTEPQRLLDTILSRCLRLTFGGGADMRFDERQLALIESFAQMAVDHGSGLLDRYKLLGQLLGLLEEMKGAVTEQLEHASPLRRYDDVEPKLKEQWENELKAGVEAEYRRRRGEMLLALEWWLRDVWLRTLDIGGELLQLSRFDELTVRVAGRIDAESALENLRTIEGTARLLHTNVQESLALEVGFLKLKLG